MTPTQIEVVRPTPGAIQLLGHYKGRVLTIGKECTAEEAEGWLQTGYCKAVSVVDEQKPERGKRGGAKKSTPTS